MHDQIRFGSRTQVRDEHQIRDDAIAPEWQWAMDAERRALPPASPLLRPWHTAVVQVPGEVRVLLWALLLADLALAAYLTAVQQQVLACGGPLCQLATFDGRTTLTLTLSAISGGALAFMAAMTWGFDRATVGELVVVGILASAGVVAIAGAALVMIFVLFVLTVIVGGVLALVGAFTEG